MQGGRDVAHTLSCCDTTCFQLYIRLIKIKVPDLHKQSQNLKIHKLITICCWFLLSCHTNFLKNGPIYIFLASHLQIGTKSCNWIAGNENFANNESNRIWPLGLVKCKWQNTMYNASCAVCKTNFCMLCQFFDLLSDTKATHVWMLASACADNTNNNNQRHHPDLELHWQAAHLLKLPNFSPILLSNTLQMDESAGACSNPLKGKKKILRLSLNTHTLKTPTCPSACPSLTSASVPTPLTPRNSCVLHSSSRALEKCQKLFLLCWFKEPWSWFSLRTIRRGQAWNKQSEGERERVRPSDFWFSFSVNWWWDLEPVTQHQTDHWHRAKLTKIRPGSHLYVLVLTWHWRREVAQDVVFGKHLW